MVEPFLRSEKEKIGARSMPSKDKITVSTKLSETESEAISFISMREHISVSAIIKLCLTGVINGDIEIEKGELKVGGDPNGYAVSDDFDIDYFGRRVEKEFDRLRERDYPEDVINMMKEEIIAGIDARIDMLPKKYDRRKIRDFDGGC